MGSGIRQPGVRILILTVGCVTLVNGLIFLSLWWRSAMAPGPGLREESVRCCMWGLHIGSQCGCGSGQSLSPGPLIGMTGVALVTGLHSRLQNTAVERRAPFSASRSFWISLASSVFLSPCLSQFLSVSFSSNFSCLLGLYSSASFLLGNSALGYEVCTVHVLGEVVLGVLRGFWEKTARG